MSTAFLTLSLLVVASHGHHLLPAAPLLAPTVVPVALPYAATIPQSRFTRTDWIQPGQRVAIPAVAQYNTITPGHTTIHAAAAPVLAAPLFHHF